MTTKTKNAIYLALFIIAVCISSTGMAQNKSMCPDDNHPHAIDLELPSGTKWACCNVNAHSPGECGEYYAWGECVEKEVYDYTTYVWGDGKTWNSFREIGSDISKSDYDAAHEKWGGLWCMPTYAQIMELYENCTLKWSKVNGLRGMVFTGPNGNCIFVPANGFKGAKGKFYDRGRLGRYWSSSQKTPTSAYRFCFDKDSKSILQNKKDYDTGNCYGQKDVGCGIRPVAK